MRVISFFSSLAVLMISFYGITLAAYNDSGTEYSSQGSDTWIQDRAADGLKMVNAFVCIVKNSNGETRPNTSWKALIDEIKCELMPTDSEGGGGVSYAEATIVSTRASNTSNQELKAYFDASGENEYYVSSMSLNASTSSAFDLIMDFRWYQVSDNNTIGTHSGSSNGWSEISVGDNDSDGDTDTIIRHTEYSPPEGADPAFSSGVAAVTYGPDNKVTKFVSSNMDYEMGAGGAKVFYQGVTDETKYRRRILASNGSTIIETKCYDRSKQWANTYEYNLYDNVTGAEKKISGSFGFTYANGTKRGFMGHWGVHLDGGNADYPSGTSSVAMVHEDTSDNMSLYAAPGRLTKITQDTITIAEGEKFKVWTGIGDRDVYYRDSCGTSNFSTASDSCSEFNFPAQNWRVQSGGSALLISGDWIYSEMNRAQIMLGTVPAATMFKRDPVTASSTSPDVSSDLALTCVGWCPKGKPLKTEYEAQPPTHENYCQAPFNNQYIDGEGNPGDSSGCTYTFKASGDSTAPLTMMRGANPVVLYNDATTPMNKTHASQGRYYSIGGGQYILTSDIGSNNCAAVQDPGAASNIWNCSGGVFEWNTGIERWDNYYYAKYDNNSFVTIETPIKLKYTFATADDQNTVFTQASPFSYIWKKDAVDGNGFRTGQGYDNVTSSTYPAQYNGKEFLLEYEGAGQIWGFPERRTDNNWLRLLNPKSGTQVVDADNSSQGYVLKAVGTGMMMAVHSNANACDSMTFAFDTTNIPVVSEKSLPAFTWASRPSIETISVTHGEEME